MGINSKWWVKEFTKKKCLKNYYPFAVVNGKTKMPTI